MITWWALADKRGKVVERTIAPTRQECWDDGYWVVVGQEGEEWKWKYWHRWDASIKSAQRLGYKFIRVSIRPVSTRTKREEK